MVLTDFDNHQINAPCAGEKKIHFVLFLLLFIFFTQHSFKVCSKETSLLVPHVLHAMCLTLGCVRKHSYACLCLDVLLVAMIQNLMTEISNIFHCLVVLYCDTLREKSLQMGTLFR